MTSSKSKQFMCNHVHCMFKWRNYYLFDGQCKQWSLCFILMTTYMKGCTFITLDTGPWRLSFQSHENHVTEAAHQFERRGRASNAAVRVSLPRRNLGVSAGLNAASVTRVPAALSLLDPFSRGRLWSVACRTNVQRANQQSEPQQHILLRPSRWLRR